MITQFFTKKKLVITLLALGLFLLVAHGASAAKIIIESQKNTIDIHEEISVDVVVNSEDETINAISGILSYDPTLVKPERVVLGGSVVNFWIEKPFFDTGTGQIVFSGIIPGGVITKQGNVFSVVFSGVKNGQAHFAITNPEILINDGNATVAHTTIKNNNLRVTSKVSESQNILIKEKIMPEKFQITRTRDQNIFDNQWFIVFASQDKDSGIAHYAVCESLFKKCQQGESPFMLHNQSGLYTILVKAYDMNDNVRYAFLISKKLIIPCVILIILGILIPYGVRFRKYKKKST